MLILASASPRRRDLLRQIGLDFIVAPAHIDERRQDSESPAIYVGRLALEKARAVQETNPDANHPDAHRLDVTILAADTTVALDDLVLNKPLDLADAARMLRRLSGRTHHVSTGIAVLRGSAQLTHTETTAVTFDPISEPDLARYVASNDPLDKAGAYGIQGFASRWIPRIEGDFFNVVGLPLAATIRLLREIGHKG